MRRLATTPVIRRILDYFPYVARGETEESRSFHIFPYRGKLVISDFEIATKFPFAFFRHRRRLRQRKRSGPYFRGFLNTTTCPMSSRRLPDVGL